MLAGDGECRLNRFHLIRNFLANEIYYFSRLSHQTGCLLTEDSTLHIISFLFSYFCLFQNAILHKMFKLVFWNFRPIFLRMEFSLIIFLWFLVLVISLSWYLHLTISYLTLPEAKWSFQTFKRSPRHWFGPKYKSKISS